MLNLATAYEQARDTRGLTVEEYEAAQGLPPFSVVPAARLARCHLDDGWFMYAERDAALAEEDRQIVCLCALGIPQKGIAALFDQSKNRVHYRIRSTQPSLLVERRADTEETTRQMVCLRRMGIILKDIGELYGCTHATVWWRTKGEM